MSENRDIKVSVVLPVYNVEQYIGKCIESLKLQTLKELEFIFVDDKSQDGSIKIVESAAREDQRICILYNDENIGAGPSRNHGIEMARGEYLSFVDPDDYLASDYYETLYNLAKEKNADVVKAHVTAVDKDDNKVEEWFDGNYAYHARSLKSKPLFYCNQNEHFSDLFRRSFILKDSEIRYADTKVGEDSVFLLRVNLKEPSFYVCNDTEYYHLVRNDSQEGTIRFESCLEGLRALEKRIEILKAHSMPEGTYDYLRSSVFYYSNQFFKTDNSQYDDEARRNNRKIFKEKLDAVLSQLPDSKAVTDNLKEYTILTEMAEGVEAVKEVNKLKTKERNTSGLRRLARKILPKSLRRAVRDIIESE